MKILHLILKDDNFSIGKYYNKMSEGNNWQICSIVFCDKYPRFCIYGHQIVKDYKPVSVPAGYSPDSILLCEIPLRMVEEVQYV